MKKPDAKILTAQEFVGVEDIADDVLYTTQKYLFAYLQVRGRDNSMLNEENHGRITEQLTQALSEETEPWQLLSVPRTVDTMGMIRELRRMRQETGNDARLKLLTGEISALEELQADGAKEPLLVLKFWRQASPGADRELKARQAKLKKKLEDNQIAAAVLHDAEILGLCRIYAELGIWQPDETEPADVPYLKGKKRLLTTRREDAAMARRAELQNELAPVGGLFFAPNKVQIGSAMGRVCGVTRYPADVSYGWAVSLFSATDCITCLTWYPGQEGEIGNALSRSISQADREAGSQRDARKRKAEERKSAAGDKLLDDLDGKGMSIGHVSILCMPYGQTEDELLRSTDAARSRFLGKRMKLKELTCLQREGFQMLSPYYPTDPLVDDMLTRIIPLETVVGGYPMTVSIIRDDHGLYFAKTPDGGIVSLDILYRGRDRTNGSGIVTGLPGTGKSTFLKHLLESTYMQGIPAIVIDPEREYRDLCKALDGAWWDAGGGTAKVNLLEPLDYPVDEESDPKYKGSVKPLALHVQQIQDIFQFKLPSLTDFHVSVLKRVLLELYRVRGIGLDASLEDIRATPHKDWPVMEDLFRQLLAERDDPYAREAAVLLEDMAVGADSVIWNGHTNVDLNNPLTVFDTNQLHNSSEENKRAQYFNIMRMCTARVTADRNEPYLLFADEAKTMISPEMPQTARALRDMAQRCRKYEGCLWLGIHSIHELLDDRIREYGQPVLDAPTYKILFGTDGRNLQDTVDLYKLTPAESKVLEARQRGKALALIGAQHLPVEFDLPAYKLELMGKGGGR